MRVAFAYLNLILLNFIFSLGRLPSDELSLHLYVFLRPWSPTVPKWAEPSLFHHLYGYIFDDFISSLHHFFKHEMCVVVPLTLGNNWYIFQCLFVDYLCAHSPCETLFFDDSMVDLLNSTYRKQ